MEENRERKEPSDDERDICRVFVSRREEEGKLIGTGTRILKRLEELGASRLKFWDMAEFTPAEEFRKEIDQQLLNSNLLLLVLTAPAREDFEWPIYEASRFSGMHHPQDARTICLHSVNQDMPRVLSHKQGVPATVDDVAKLLFEIYNNKDFTLTKAPINPEISEETLVDLATQICKLLNDPIVDAIEDTKFVNPSIKITFEIPKEEKCRILKDRKLLRGKIDDGRISPTANTLQNMFGLEPKGSGVKWTWGELFEQVSQLEINDQGDFNRQWMQELEPILFNRLKSRTVRQIESGFLAHDRNVWQPEVESIQSFSSGRIIVNMVFSPRPHRTWMRNVDELDSGLTPGAGLAANLMLGSRIRQEVIEETESALTEWGDDPESIKAGFAELERLINGVQRDGFFIKVLTKDSISRAFTGIDEKNELQQIDRDFRDNIGPPLQQALSSIDVGKLKDAIAKWKLNNARFMTIALQRYSDIKP